MQVVHRLHSWQREAFDEILTESYELVNHGFEENIQLILNIEKVIPSLVSMRSDIDLDLVFMSKSNRESWIRFLKDTVVSCETQLVIF